MRQGRGDGEPGKWGTGGPCGCAQSAALRARVPGFPGDSWPVGGEPEQSGTEKGRDQLECLATGAQRAEAQGEVSW